MPLTFSKILGKPCFQMNYPVQNRQQVDLPAVLLKPDSNNNVPKAGVIRSWPTPNIYDFLADVVSLSPALRIGKIGEYLTGKALAFWTQRFVTHLEASTETLSLGLKSYFKDPINYYPEAVNRCFGNFSVCFSIS
jgi:hypothetical protein